MCTEKCKYKCVLEGRMQQIFTVFLYATLNSSAPASATLLISLLEGMWINIMHFMPFPLTVIKMEETWQRQCSLKINLAQPQLKHPGHSSGRSVIRNLKCVSSHTLRSISTTRVEDNQRQNGAGNQLSTPRHQMVTWWGPEAGICTRFPSGPSAHREDVCDSGRRAS